MRVRMFLSYDDDDTLERIRRGVDDTSISASFLMFHDP